MRDEIKKLAWHRLSRAEETFRDGEIMLENGSYNSAINRFYYAGFYAARALLATQELDSSKHSGIISLFQKNFVKTGIIPEHISKALPRSFEERIDMDYEDFVSIGCDEVKKIRDDVRAFIEVCKKELQKLAL